MAFLKTGMQSVVYTVQPPREVILRSREAARPERPNWVFGKAPRTPLTETVQQLIDNTANRQNLVIVEEPRDVFELQEVYESPLDATVAETTGQYPFF